MIFALGSIMWMSPTWAQLFGSLSTKNGRSVSRWTRVRSIYSSPSARSRRRMPMSLSAEIQWGLLERALELGRASGDVRIEGIMLSNLGSLHADPGRFGAANGTKCGGHYQLERCSRSAPRSPSFRR